MIIRIEKAIEDGKAEYTKSKADYKRAHQGLKCKWRETTETIEILQKQERLITRCTDLETALKIIAEFEEAT